MLNHFLRFADEAAATASLPRFGMPIDGIWVWDATRVIAHQRVVLVRATVDGEGNIVAPAVCVPGWFMTVSLHEIDPGLRDLPDAACRLIGNSETGSIIYAAPDVDPGMLASAIIEPVPAGARYTFGGDL